MSFLYSKLFHYRQYWRSGGKFPFEILGYECNAWKKRYLFRNTKLAWYDFMSNAWISYKLLLIISTGMHAFTLYVLVDCFVLIATFLVRLQMFAEILIWIRITRRIDSTSNYCSIYLQNDAIGYIFVGWITLGFGHKLRCQCRTYKMHRQVKSSVWWKCL